MTTNSPSVAAPRTDVARLEAQLAELRAQLRSTEERLRNAEVDLDFALWGGSLTLWKLNLKTRQVEFSDGWYQMHHFSRTHTTNLDALKTRIHPEDFDAVARAHREHFDGRATHTEIEYRLLGGDDSWRWVHERSHVVERDAEGRPITVAGTQYEITLRKRAEQAAREQGLRFQAFMDHLPSAVFIKDPEGHYLFGNGAWAAQFHRPPEQILGLTDFDLWSPEAAAAFRASDAQLMASDQPQHLYECVGSGESRQVFAVTKFLMQDRNGAPLLGGIATDVTEQARMEEQLRESEQRFRELTQTVGLIPWEWDCRLERYTYVGPQAERILGYPLSTWQEPDFWARTIHPDDRERTVASCHQHGGDHYEVEYVGSPGTELEFAL